MNRSEKILYFSEAVNKFLLQNELYLTMENIRRFFDLKYNKLPSEKAIEEIYLILEKGDK